MEATLEITHMPAADMYKLATIEGNTTTGYLWITGEQFKTLQTYKHGTSKNKKVT
jgi:hypothetical protein